MARGRESRLAPLLVKAGLITQQQMAQTMAEHARRGGALPPLIVEMGIASGPAIARTISAATHIPMVELGPRFLCEPQARALVDANLAAAELIMPYAMRDKGATLWLAMADPTDEETVNKIIQSSMKRVRPVVAACDDIQEALKSVYNIGGRKTQAIELDLGRPSDEPMVVTDISSDQVILEVPTAREEGGTPNVPVAPAVGDTPTGMTGPIDDLSPGELDRLKALRESQREASRMLKAVLDLCVEKGVLPLEEYKRRSRDV